MPVKSDDPLRRVTLNLYEADCQILDEVIGYGWTTRIRQEVAKLAHSLRPNRSSIASRPRTLGDLDNG